MDPAVRKSATAERRLLQSLYEQEGTVGEGAFGVVLKASVKPHPHSSSSSSTLDTAAHEHAPWSREGQDHYAASAASSSSSAAAASAASASAGAAAACACAAAPTYVAIKKMLNHREGQGIPQDAYREIKILKELRHDNLVRLERVFTRPEKHEVDLVYEFAEHDLAEIIKCNRTRHQAMHVAGDPNAKLGPTDPRMLKSVLQQVLHGLAFLHSSWCVHRDMKPANILVTGLAPATAAGAGGGGREGGRVKIGDFGLARIFQSPLRKLSDDGEVVTIWYRAPELLLGSKHYTRSIDMFACGCIFYELMTCSPLFPGQEVKPLPNASTAASARPFQENQMREVIKVLGKPSRENWPGIAEMPHYAHIQNWPAKDYPFALDARLPTASAGGSQLARDLLRAMLAYDPARRITAEDALNHPYFREDPRPDPNAFLSKDGQTYLSYPLRPTKSISESKRMKEHEGANAAAAAAGAGGAAAAAASSSHPPLHPHAAQAHASSQAQHRLVSGLAQDHQRHVAAMQQNLIYANGPVLMPPHAIDYSHDAFAQIGFMPSAELRRQAQQAQQPRPLQPQTYESHLAAYNLPQLGPNDSYAQQPPNKQQRTHY